MTPAPKPKKEVKTTQIKGRSMGLTSSRLKDKPKKAQPAVQRKKTLQRLEKELDELWKKIVYKNWGNKCAWPGCKVTQPPKQLFCHHYFHKAQGNRARWEPLNGVLLCYGHHMGQVHRSGNVEPIREVLIKRIGIVGFEALRLRVSVIFKPTLENLREMKERLLSELEAK